MSTHVDLENVTELIHIRDIRDRSAQRARATLVDAIAEDAHEDDILAAAVSLVTARARVTVADTAVTYARSGDPLGQLAAYLTAAFASGPVEDANPAETARRRGYLAEIEAQRLLALPHL